MRSHGRALAAGITVALLSLAAGATWVLWPTPGPSAQDEPLSVSEALGQGGPADAYARAREPRTFHFPEDHGPHPAYRNEWWYWTGNLTSAEGRRFGYQLTFFRSALAPGMKERASAWATRQLYMAHFTVSDLESGRFHAFERFGREALGLAGASLAPFHVWLEDWEVRGAGTGFGPLALEAREGAVGLSLHLEEGKPPVLQGDRGLSQKGPAPGDASYYYSLTRMPTRGTVTVEGERYSVTGASWMDREWGTSALGPEQVGWDWFALQLSDGSELMYYQLRRKDGSADAWSGGTFIPASGAPVRLDREMLALEVNATWQSPTSGARYPAGWTLRVPSQALELKVRPALADQELPVSFRYWEGSVAVEGVRDAAPVAGRGYVELTGYGERAAHRDVD